MRRPAGPPTIAVRRTACAARAALAVDVTPRIRIRSAPQAKCAKRTSVSRWTGKAETRASIPAAPAMIQPCVGLTRPCVGSSACQLPTAVPRLVKTRATVRAGSALGFARVAAAPAAATAMTISSAALAKHASLARMGRASVAPCHVRSKFAIKPPQSVVIYAPHARRIVTLVSAGPIRTADKAAAPAVTARSAT